MSGKETSQDTRPDSGVEADFGFRRVPEAAKAPLVRAVFDSVASRYDLMNDLMSGDIAVRALKRLDPERGGSVIVCDINQQMLDAGRARAIDDGILAGVEWVCGDAEALPIADRSVDLYTIGFGLRNVTHIERALAEARRVLKIGGRFLCLEFAPAAAPWLAPAYDFYSFRVLPLIGQIVAGDRDAYRYLVESIRGFPPQAALRELIEAAGLERVRFRNLTGGVAALHSAWRL
jgi:demethylmenaquinone methyltransferase/2-methoxy-6-polyprenyl-1,4-benzoquinol methylase